MDPAPAPKKPGAASNKRNPTIRHSAPPATAFRPLLSGLFGQMTDGQFGLLAGLIEWVDLLGGECLFSEGDPGDALYILLNGRLQVRLKDEKGKARFAEISKGESVGEMALLSGENRSATVVAIRDCHLARLSKASFELFFERCPAVGLNLARLVIARFSKSKGKRQFRQIDNIAVVGTDASVDVRAFVRELLPFFPQGKKCLLLDSGAVDTFFGENIAQTPPALSEKNKVLSAWLDAQEAQHDFVFYLADRTTTEWTRRCARQADEVLLLADIARPAGNAADPIADLKMAPDTGLAGPGPKFTLVLQHPPGVVMPTGTAAWLQAYRPDGHFHLRTATAQPDFARLARYLTDQTTGLALAGGGVRGFAHIGVWRALQEANIPVDVVGGTSMGAFVGGLMAFGWDHRAVREAVRGIALSRPSRDFNLLPLVSLIGGKHLDRALRHFYGGSDIEDCVLKFYCISSNLSLAQPEIHLYGDMFKAVRASGSLPGIVPPVVLNGSLLIDGGVFNNFPVDIMAEMGIGNIIGVEMPPGKQRPLDYYELPGTWEVLKNHVFRTDGGANVPSLVSTLMQTTTLTSNYNQKQARTLADVLIAPSVASFGFLQWEAFDKIVEAGYQEAVKVLSAR